MKHLKSIFLFLVSFVVFAISANAAGAGVAAWGDFMTSNASLQEAFESMDKGTMLYNLSKKSRYQEELLGLRYYQNYNEFWLRGYTKSDTVDVKDDTEIDSDIYGLYVGMDQAIDLGLPAATLSFYIAYNGAHQKYKDYGATVNRNGAMIGLTLVAQEEILFYGAAVNGYYNKNEVSNDVIDGYGLNAAFKIGLNFTSEEGLVTFQPAVMGSYSLLAYEDVDDPNHIWQVAPQATLLFDLGRGCEPYLKVLGSYARMVEDKDNPGSDDVYIKPYIDYGIGLQTQWIGATSFIEATWRSGGLEGFALKAGINF
jgi:Autotransporter beta-domain.